MERVLEIKNLINTVNKLNGESLVFPPLIRLQTYELVKLLYATNILLKTKLNVKSKGEVSFVIHLIIIVINIYLKNK